MWYLIHTHTDILLTCDHTSKRMKQFHFQLNWEEQISTDTFSYRPFLPLSFRQLNVIIPTEPPPSSKAPFEEKGSWILISPCCLRMYIAHFIQLLLVHLWGCQLFDFLHLRYDVIVAHNFFAYLEMLKLYHRLSPAKALNMHITLINGPTRMYLHWKTCRKDQSMTVRLQVMVFNASNTSRSAMSNRSRRESTSYWMKLNRIHRTKLSRKVLLL